MRNFLLLFFTIIICLERSEADKNTPSFRSPPVESRKKDPTVRYIVSLFAGNFTKGPGYSGNNGPALNGQFNSPIKGIPHGSDLYISDYGNNVYRKINSRGVLSTVIGNYSLKRGFSGDGGPATNARINGPRSVSFDKFGNMYIADVFNNVIRKINTRGIISTFAGNWSKGDGFSGDGGPATSAQLRYPYDTTFDRVGNMYIADTSNNVIRKVDRATGIITTVVGDYTKGPGYSGDGGLALSAQMNGPLTIAFDPFDNMFITDIYNNVIRRVDSVTKIITTFASNYTKGPGYSGDGGLASNAQFNQPYSPISDAYGNIFISDSSNNVIRRVDRTTNIVTTVVGNYTKGPGYSGDNGPALSAQFNSLGGVFFNALGEMYITDTGNSLIRKASFSKKRDGDDSTNEMPLP
jgi:hypothetical protein